jgi:hypothetical protein
MKNIFNHLHYEVIFNRIDKLNTNPQLHWRKMGVAKMYAHYSSFQDIAMRNTFSPRGWVWRFL